MGSACGTGGQRGTASVLGVVGRGRGEGLHLRWGEQRCLVNALCHSLGSGRGAPLPLLEAVEDEVGEEGELDGLRACAGGDDHPQHREEAGDERESHPFIGPEEDAGAPGK